MADFKEVVAKLEDNGKQVMYINELVKFQAKKKHDELTTRVDSGWGLKVATGKSVVFTLIVDRDKFDRICNEVDGEKHEVDDDD